MKLRVCKWFKFIYPFEDDELFAFVDQFDFDRAEGFPKVDSGPLERAVAAWRRDGSKALLVYWRDSDGGTLIDTRPGAAETRITLDRLAADVYAFIDVPRRFVDIVRHVGVPSDQVAALLDDFWNRKIVVRENDDYLAVALSDCSINPWVAIATLEEARIRDPSRRGTVDGGIVALGVSTSPL